jgi:hypothetical protein
LAVDCTPPSDCQAKTRASGILRVHFGLGGIDPLARLGHKPMMFLEYDLPEKGDSPSIHLPAIGGPVGLRRAAA